MSSAKKTASENEIIPQVGVDPESEERRKDSDSQRRDRRVIPRVAHPEMRRFFGHISKLCRLWVGLSVAYGIVLMIASVSGGKLAFGRSLFYATVVTIIAIGTFRFGKAIDSYLNSESQAKLVTVSERCFYLLFISMLLATIMGVVHLVTLF